MRLEIKKVLKKNFFRNEFGFVLKLLTKNKDFDKISEIYLTSVSKNKIKGWNMHLKYRTKMILISGKVNFYYSKNTIIRKKKIIKSTEKKIITIYPKTYFAFEGLEKNCVFLTTSSGPHNKKEIQKVEFKK